MEPTLTARDWTLLALAASHGQPIGKLWLQKTLFLLGRHFNLSAVDGFYDFKPYNFGPYCADVFADAERFEKQGFVAIANGKQHTTYTITDEGLLRASSLNLSYENRSFLFRLVAAVRSLDFETLCHYVYSEFPEMAANSKFREIGRPNAPKIYDWLDEMERGSADDEFMRTLVTACGRHDSDEEAILAELDRI